MAKIKKGDLVQVITGAKAERGGDRGKQGKVLRVFPDTNRVLVEGINRVTKHTKVGQSQRGTKTGGIEVVEAPIHISNVALWNADEARAVKVGWKVEDGRKVRFDKKTGSTLD
jgi:large subunit ribosomal protein L24